MKRSGLAQIPLMIGLLLMAIAIPVATKLVQDNQDTRNKAAYNDCAGEGVAPWSGYPCCPGLKLVTVGGKTVCGSGINSSPTPATKTCISYNWVGQVCTKKTDLNWPSNKACPTSNCVAGQATPIPTQSTPFCKTTLVCTCGCQATTAGGYCKTCPTATPTTGGGTCNQNYSGDSKCVGNTLTTCSYVSSVFKWVTQDCGSLGCRTLSFVDAKCNACTATSPKTCIDSQKLQSCDTSTGSFKTTLCFIPESCVAENGSASCKGPGTQLSTCTLAEYNAGARKCDNGFSMGCQKTATSTRTIYYAWFRLGDYCVNGCETNTASPNFGKCKTAPPASPTPTIPTVTTCPVGSIKVNSSICGREQILVARISSSVVCCKNLVPTLTPTVTLKPTATPTGGTLKCYCSINCASGECNWQTGPSGSFDRFCSNSYCSAIPTPIYTCARTSTQICQPNATNCTSGVGTCSTGYHCCKKATVTVAPTNTPVPGCLTGTCLTTGKVCCYGSQTVISSVCTSLKKCLSAPILPSSTPIPVATNTPVPGCIQNGACKTSGKVCCSGFSQTVATSVCSSGKRCFAGPTVTPSKPPARCTQCASLPGAKGKGDADCSGATNINDASIWRSEFISGELGTVIKNNWQADFDCDGKVTINDISIWRDNFIKGL